MDVEAIKQVPQRILLAKQEAYKMLEEMKIIQKIIQPSNSRWVCLIVLVQQILSQLSKTQCHHNERQLSLAMKTLTRNLR